MSDDSLATLTAAPAAFDFKGEHYTLTPLGLRDRAQLGGFIRSYIARQAVAVEKAMVEAGAPPEHLAALRDELVVGLRSPMLGDWRTEFEPQVETVWLALSHEHKGIKRSLVEEMVDDESTFDEISNQFAELSNRGKMPIREKWMRVLGAFLTCRDAPDGQVTDTDRWKSMAYAFGQTADAAELAVKNVPTPRTATPGTK